jgi:hypothetical protein
MSETKTNVQQTQVEDLDNLLGMPGAESVITAEGGEGGEGEGSPSFFASKGADMSAFNMAGNEGKPEGEGDEGGAAGAEGGEGEGGEGSGGKGAEGAAAGTGEGESFEGVLGELGEGEGEGEGSGKSGRPKLDKAGMAQLAEKMIEKKMILPFQDDKPLEDYTMDDYLELMEVNFQEREKKLRAETPQEFFQSLPPELQQAAQYVASGGTDMKGLFKHLASSEEVKDLSIDTERGQETVVREYLRAKQFGTEDDIQEEIDSWKDLGKLGAKAEKFKPELDKMQDQIVQQQILSQEAKRKQQEDASLAYMENVYETLQTGDLNGIKLNGKIQNMLYAGLVQPNYPSISGKPTNLFGHLIEKYQFVEPDHGRIAEALWLLADPDGYKEQITTNAKNAQVADTARTLKTEQANKNATGAEPASQQGSGRASTGLPRPTKDFFKR